MPHLCLTDREELAVLAFFGISPVANEEQEIPSQTSALLASLDCQATLKNLAESQ